MNRQRAPGLVCGIALATLAATTLALAIRQAGNAQAGWTFVLASPDRWMAVAGLGIVLGTVRRAIRIAALTGLLAGFALGIGVRHSDLWIGLASPTIYPRLHLLGPAACVLPGLLLVLRPSWRPLALPFLAIGIGAALMLTAAINDPNPDGLAFEASAGVAMLWLLLAIAALRGLVAGAWIPLGERILGSWLLTIGVLLGGVQFMPAREPVLPVVPPAAPVAAPSFEPDSGFTLRPDAGPLAPPFGGGLPRGTN